MKNRICVSIFVPLFAAFLLSGCLHDASVPLIVDGIQTHYNQTTIQGAPVDSIDPFLLFSELRGRRVVTGGWADYANDGQGITYANPEYPVIINDVLFPDPIAKLQAFRDALNRRDQHVFIIICGDIDLSEGRITDAPGRIRGVTDYRVEDRMLSIGSSNTTIIGINNARIMFGGLRMDDKQNVIIRNLTFWDARDTRRRPGLDHLAICGYETTGIWVNHVKFSTGASNHRDGGDWHDTLLNISRGEVTVSWSEFTNANEVLLVGGGNTGEFPRDATEDELLRLRERRRVTLHHNYFHNARDRMPRTRAAQMHIYNNFYRNIWWHAIGPGKNAHMVVQNNLFDSIWRDKAVHWWFRRAGAIVWHSGNAGAPLSARGSRPAVLVTNPSPKPWNPSDFYTYTLDDDVYGLRTLIPKRAGPTLVTIEDFLR